MADEPARRPELPVVVGRMWGREPTSRRGPKPSLDLARITAAATEIADAEGLGAVSMNNVATRLGVAPMSLYRYVGSKDDLLLAMLDAATGEPPDPGGPYRDYLHRWTRANAEVMLARPWLLQIAPSGPPMGPRGLRWLDRLLRALADTPLDHGEKIGIATTLSGYALNQASLMLSLAPQAPHGALPESSHQYGEILGLLVDDETYPELSAAVRAGAFDSDDQAWYEDSDFRFGLDLLLDGIDALIARRSRAG